MWIESNIPSLPFGLDGHTATLVNEKVLVFGGSTMNSSNTLQSSATLWELDFKSMKWKEIVPNNLTSQCPRPRVWHTASHVNDSIYIFGGRNSKLQYFNDMWIYNLRTQTWSQCKGEGKPPSKRAAHTACVVGRYIYIFGGRYKNKKSVQLSTGLTHSHHADIHCFDTLTETWIQENTKGNSPSPRASMIMTKFESDNTTKLVILGGYTCTNQYFQYFDDCNSYDVERHLWEKLPGGNMPPMTSSTSSLYNNSLYVFGGEGVMPYGNKTLYSPFLYKINLEA